MGVAYRFRNATTLLSKKELEDQYVYFSSPQNLNDPNEGLRNMVWKGDKIVWDNFFGHFLWCLQVYHAVLQLEGQERELTNEDIRVTRVVRIPPVQHGYAHIDDFSDTVFRDASIDDIVASIGVRPIRYNEVVQYLETIHSFALVALERMFQDNKSLPESESKTRSSKLPQGILDLNDDLKNGFLDAAGGMLDDLRLYARLQRPAPRTVFERNAQKLIFDFPKSYLDRLDTLLYPKWYIACFSDDISNSSMWSHYADKHRGVSLIFTTDDAESDESIALNCITGFSSTGAHHKVHRSLVPMKLYRVEYGTSRGEIDYFRSMGNVPKNELFTLWYTDHQGRVSGLSHDIGETRWRNDYWLNFFPDITNKSVDWSYEKERRLVLYGLLGDDLENEEDCKCSYEFRTLKGIVFGIRTPDETKKRIINILAEKCRVDSRSDFELYQAFYSRLDDSIGKRRISIRGFS